MAAKLKVQDVLSDGKRVGLVGNGKTPHVLRTDTPTPAASCNGKAATETDNLAGELNICNNCAKVYNNDTKENETVTETTDAPQADETEQAKADIENIINELSKLNKNDKDKILALEGQGNGELLRIKSANKRAPLSMRFKEAVAQAKERKPGAEIALRPETKAVSEIVGYNDIVDNAARLVAEGIKSQVNAHETARKVATAILDGRLRIYNKQGLPDLTGARRASKDLARDIYQEAARRLHADQWGGEAQADYETLEKQLKDKVQYQMTAVLPAFVYSLDHSPEQFAEFFPAQAKALEELRAEGDENTKPSDLIFELYGINRKSKAELAAERRAKAKELESGQTGTEGEGSDAEGEGSEGEGSDDSGTADKSPVLKLADTLGKTTEKLSKVKVDELTDEEAKALAEQLKALTDATQVIALALAGRK